MPLQLVSQGWRARLLDAARGASHVRLVCPFIKETVAREILNAAGGSKVEVITRLNLADLFHGVSDVGALRLLKQHGARIRAVRDLHAKLYIFDDDRAILTSANLTAAALDRNHEFGGVLTGASELEECIRYFARRWHDAGSDLTDELLTRCEKELSKAKATGARLLPKNLIDLGKAAGLSAVASAIAEIPIEASFLARYVHPPRAFVKIFGTGADRFQLSTPVIEEIDHSGSHWACTFSENKVPRLEDGSVMFMSRTVEGRGHRVYGIALALQHRRNRDVASSAELEIRPWKEKWPYYVRVHHAAFVAGTLANGISLYEMMDALEHDTFMSTSRNFREDNGGNTDPRESLRQAAYRELTTVAHQWLLKRLGEAFERHGMISEFDLSALDWPDTAGA